MTNRNTLHQEFDVINYCSSGILVFCFVATGVACARRYLQWFRLSADVKRDIWALYALQSLPRFIFVTSSMYGIFCALGSVGCTAGCVAFVCLMIGNM